MRMPRSSRYLIDSGKTGPSSNPIRIASSRRAPQTTLRTPLHKIAPKHIAHGAHEVKSSNGGAERSLSVCEFMDCSASISAKTSACIAEFRRSSTTLTPTETREWSVALKTAAPNGPPVPRRTFSRDNAIASRILSTSVTNRSLGLHTSITHSGKESRTSVVNIRCFAVSIMFASHSFLPKRPVHCLRTTSFGW